MNEFTASLTERAMRIHLDDCKPLQDLLIRAETAIILAQDNLEDKYVADTLAQLELYTKIYRGTVV